MLRNSFQQRLLKQKKKHQNFNDLQNPTIFPRLEAGDCRCDLRCVSIPPSNAHRTNNRNWFCNLKPVPSLLENKQTNKILFHIFCNCNQCVRSMFTIPRKSFLTNSNKNNPQHPSCGCLFFSMAYFVILNAWYFLKIDFLFYICW